MAGYSGVWLEVYRDDTENLRVSTDGRYVTRVEGFSVRIEGYSDTLEIGDSLDAMKDYLGEGSEIETGLTLYEGDRHFLEVRHDGQVVLGFVLSTTPSLP